MSSCFYPTRQAEQAACCCKLIRCIYILSVGMRYVVDSIGVVEMCCYILREHKYILFKE